VLTSFGVYWTLGQKIATLQYFMVKPYPVINFFATSCGRVVRHLRNLTNHTFRIYRVLASTL
jgi:hypothetical protein